MQSATVPVEQLTATISDPGNGRIRVVCGDDRFQARGEVGVRDWNSEARCGVRSAVDVIGDSRVRADAKCEWLYLGQGVGVTISELGVDLLLFREVVLDDAGNQRAVGRDRDSS